MLKLGNKGILMRFNNKIFMLSFFVKERPSPPANSSWMVQCWTNWKEKIDKLILLKGYTTLRFNKVSMLVFLD